jgi:hypothetical protein
MASSLSFHMRRISKPKTVYFQGAWVMRMVRDFPDGFIYIFVDGYLWREIRVALGYFTDVDLRVSEGRREPFSHHQEEGIILPAKINGHYPVIELAYREVQWTWERLEYYGGLAPDDVRRLEPNKIEGSEEKAKQRRAKRFVPVELKNYVDEDMHQLYYATSYQNRSKDRTGYGGLSFYERYDACHVVIPVPLVPIQNAFEDIIYLTSELSALMADSKQSENFTIAHHLYHYIFGSIANRFGDCQTSAAVKQAAPSLGRRLTAIYEASMMKFASHFLPDDTIASRIVKKASDQIADQTYDREIRLLSDLESAAAITDLDAIKDKLLVDKRLRVKDLIHELQMGLIRLVQPDDQPPIVPVHSVLNDEQEILWTDALMDWIAGSVEDYSQAFNYLMLITNNAKLEADLIDYEMDIHHPKRMRQELTPGEKLLESFIAEGHPLRSFLLPKEPMKNVPQAVQEKVFLPNFFYYYPNFKLDGEAKFRPEYHAYANSVTFEVGLSNALDVLSKVNETFIAPLISNFFKKGSLYYENREVITLEAIASHASLNVRSEETISEAFTKLHQQSLARNQQIAVSEYQYSTQGVANDNTVKATTINERFYARHYEKYIENLQSHKALLELELASLEKASADSTGVKALIEELDTLLTSDRDNLKQKFIAEMKLVVENFIKDNKVKHNRELTSAQLNKIFKRVYEKINQKLLPNFKRYLFSEVSVMTVAKNQRGLQSIGQATKGISVGAAGIMCVVNAYQLYSEKSKYKKAIDNDYVKAVEITSMLFNQFYLLEELAVAYNGWDNVEYFFLKDAGRHSKELTLFFRTRGFGIAPLFFLGVLSSGINFGLSIANLSIQLQEQQYYLASLHAAKSVSSLGVFTLLVGNMARRRQKQIIEEAILDASISGITDKAKHNAMMQICRKMFDSFYRNSASSAMRVTVAEGTSVMIETGVKFGLRRALYGYFLLFSQPGLGAGMFFMDMLLGLYISYYTPGELESFVATTPFALTPPAHTDPEMLLLFKFAAITFKPQAKLVKASKFGDYQILFRLPFFDASKHKIRLRITIERHLKQKYQLNAPSIIDNYIRESVQYKLLEEHALTVQQDGQHTRVTTKARLTNHTFKHFETYRVTVEYQIVVEDNITLPILRLSATDPQVTALKQRKRLQYNVHRLEDDAQTCFHAKGWYAIRPIDIWRDDSRPENISYFLDNLPK